MTSALSYADARELRSALELVMEEAHREDYSVRIAAPPSGKVIAAVVAALMDVVPSEAMMKRRNEAHAKRMLPYVTALLSGVLEEDMADPLRMYLDTPIGKFNFGTLMAAWKSPDSEPEVTDAQRSAAHARFRALRAGPAK